MFRTYAGCAGLAALVLASPAFAHHPSGVSSTGGAGPIATITGSTLDQGQSAAVVFFEMVKINPISDAQLKTFAGQHIHAHSMDAILAPTLIYAYGITNDLTVIGRLPVVTRLDIREGHHSHGPAGNSVDERGDSSGIGDLTLLGQYRFYNNKATRTEAALLLGVKAPTGRTNEYDKLGERFETEFQPGSGSWDGLFGAAFTQRAGAWSFDGNVLYHLATKGAQETDLGDRFQYNLAVSYRLVGAAASLERPHVRRGSARADVSRRAEGRRPSPRPSGAAATAARAQARSRARAQRRMARAPDDRRRQGRELRRQRRLSLAGLAALLGQVVGRSPRSAFPSSTMSTACRPSPIGACSPALPSASEAQG